MNTIAAANNSSALYRALEKVPYSNPWLYSIRNNIPPIAHHPRMAVEVDALTGGSPVTFDVPRSGVLNSLHLRITITVGAANTTTGPWGSLCLFDSVDLITRSGSILQHLTTTEIIDFIKSSPESRRLLFESASFAAEAATPYTAATSYSVFVPLPFAMLYRANNNWDTQICEPLQIRVNTMSAAGADNYFGTTALTSAKYEMVFGFITLSDRLQREYNSLIVNSGSTGVARMMWSSIQSSQSLNAINANAAHTEYVDIRIKVPLFKVIFEFAADDAVNYKNRHADSLANYLGRPTKIDLLASGTPIRTWYLNEIEMEDVMHGHSKKLTVSGTTFTIHFNMTDDRSDITGFLPLGNITDPRWLLTWSGTHAAMGACKIVTTYIYYTQESMRPADGVITTQSIY